MTVFLRHKYRYLGGPAVMLGKHYHIATGNWDHDHAEVLSQGLEEMWDSGGNPVKNGHYSGGSFFRTYKYGQNVRTPSNGIVAGENLKGGPIYVGSLLCSGPEASVGAGEYPWWEVIPDLSNFDEDNYQSEAWDRLRPDKPSMDIPLAIYELKDVPGMLRQRFLRNGLSEIGNYYLALKFGWEPLLRDIINFTVNMFALKKAYDQLLRDEGKPIRRRVTLNSVDNRTSDEVGQGYGVFPIDFTTQMFAEVPFYKDYVLWGKKTWAVGQFQYFLPPGPRDWEWTARMKAKILGLYPSPATVYRAIPWTWLIDSYFVNIGTWINNVSGTSTADSLVCNYGYIMQHKFVHGVREGHCAFNKPGGGTNTAFAMTKRIYESKGRAVIGSFGPTVNDGNISNSQLAILGALGLSRVRTS